jgi:F0F1-type ATP synthase assembly protein I
MATLVLAVWFGYRLDHFFSVFPLLTALLPLIVLLISFYKIIRDTRP